MLIEPLIGILKYVWVHRAYPCCDGKIIVELLDPVFEGFLDICEEVCPALFITCITA